MISSDVHSDPIASNYDFLGFREPPSGILIDGTRNNVRTDNTILSIGNVRFCFPLYSNYFGFQILRRRPILPVRKQNFMRIRLRRKDGVREHGLQPCDSCPAETTCYKHTTVGTYATVYFANLLTRGPNAFLE